MIRVRRGKNAANLSAEERALFDRPWLNSYAPVDLVTGPQDENAKLFQIETQGFIFRHIRDALASCQANSSGIVPTVGDGLYGIYALSHGARKVRITSIGDHVPHRQPYQFEQTKLAAEILGVSDRCTFDHADVLAIQGAYDFGILANCLIHFPEPNSVLAHMRELITGPLVLFSTTIFRRVNLAFEAPASGRPWGSAFTHDMLLTMAVDAGWTVVNEQYKQMPETWVGERNFSSFLCV